MDTKEQARKLIPLLQAYADGKALQWCNPDTNVWVKTYRPPTWEWGYWSQFPEDRSKLKKYAEKLRKRQERDLSR